MEAEIRGKALSFCGSVLSDMKSVGKKPMEWDLNEWKWDGDLFTAVPLNSVPSDCRNMQLLPFGSEIPPRITLSTSSTSCSDEGDPRDGRGKRDLEKRRRAIVVEDNLLNDEAGSLNLQLGGQVYPITEGEVEGKSGKKSKIAGSTSNRAVCQVEGCQADLSNAKDYHRRHKVCDMHSKATRALVGNVMQRFCQQCSRFHLLQEFDEGKRSCRRRLAGHNRRRRKTHPENVVNAASLNEERGSSYLLISLLKILSNIHSNNSDQTKDQDFLSHLLKNLANVAGTTEERCVPGLLRGCQDLQTPGTSGGIAEKDPPRTTKPCLIAPASEMIRKRPTDDTDNGASTIPSNSILFPSRDSVPPKANTLDSKPGRVKLSNIDLNNVYDDSQDCEQNLFSCDGLANVQNGSLDCPSQIHRDSHKSSPPQTSGNSGSTSSQSPSSSSGDAQSRTDRIVFKLFGKDPSDFPLVLRKQILDWLSHSPTDIESYIRPGCIILTIYLRMEKSAWDKLSCNLSYNLARLIEASGDSFWRTGWIYTRVRHRVAFVYNGLVVLDTPLPFKSHNCGTISNISPIAVSVSDKAKFSVKGFNLSLSTTRLLCALEGKYLVQGRCSDLMEGHEIEQDDSQSCLNFCCSIPNVTGRGFIEVEDYGLCSSFFPFIVAEQDVCSEIRTLESTLEVSEAAYFVGGETRKMETRDMALDFIHEIGWLLHRSHLKVRLSEMDSKFDLFPYKRFKWLMEFSVEHDWCAVVKKLLDILFNDTVDAGDHHSVHAALMEIGLVHRAVRRNCRSMVEMLLRYIPDEVLAKSGHEQKQHFKRGLNLFRPDEAGPQGLTPLHVAASRKGSENVLDALTDDPGLVGIEAWKRACDSTGLTPNDYACLRGHYSYVNLVQKKLEKKSAGGHVVLDIPGPPLDFNIKQKVVDGHGSMKVSGFQTEKTMQPIRRHCRLCDQKLAYGSCRASLAVYRPSMLSMVAIAAVCVCVALLFKSSPEVLYVFQPFRWELLKYGSS